MPQIIPIKDLKNTSEISDMCHKADGPIYITKTRIWRHGNHEYGNIRKYHETAFYVQRY